MINNILGPFETGIEAVCRLWWPDEPIEDPGSLKFLSHGNIEILLQQASKHNLLESDEVVNVHEFVRKMIEFESKIAESGVVEDVHKLNEKFLFGLAVAKNEYTDYSNGLLLKRALGENNLDADEVDWSTGEYTGYDYYKRDGFDMCQFNREQWKRDVQYVRRPGSSMEKPNKNDLFESLKMQESADIDSNIVTDNLLDFETWALDQLNQKKDYCVNNNTNIDTNVDSYYDVDVSDSLCEHTDVEFYRAGFNKCVSCFAIIQMDDEDLDPQIQQQTTYENGFQRKTKQDLEMEKTVFICYNLATLDKELEVLNMFDILEISDTDIKWIRDLFTVVLQETRKNEKKLRIYKTELIDEMFREKGLIMPEEFINSSSQEISGCSKQDKITNKERVEFAEFLFKNAVNLKPPVAHTHKNKLEILDNISTEKSEHDKTSCLLWALYRETQKPITDETKLFKQIAEQMFFSSVMTKESLKILENPLKTGKLLNLLEHIGSR